MIRLLFAMFVTAAGFAALALWSARGGDAREVVEEIFPAEVRKEVRSALDRFDLEEVASRLPEAATSRLPDAAASRLPGAVAKEEAADDRDAGGEPAKAVVAEQAEITEEAEMGEEAVEERDLSPRAEFARDLGAADDEGSAEVDGEEMVTAAAGSDRIWRDRGAPLREPDQDAWASLIRRMLAVYQRTGEFE